MDRTDLVRSTTIWAVALAALLTAVKGAFAVGAVDPSYIKSLAAPGKAVLVVSLEMSALELGDRLLCSRARVNSHRLRNGQLREEEMHRLIQTAAEVSRGISASRSGLGDSATASKISRSREPSPCPIC